MAGEILSQLPEDLRTNEVFTGMNTAGDLGKALLDSHGKLKEFDGKVKDYEGKIGDLEGRITNYIPKITDKSTDGEKAAYFKAIGRPDKAEEYEFPQVEGRENDPGMVKWAQGTFHKAGLSKEQAKAIGTEWNAFVAGMVETEDKLVMEERTTNEKVFRSQFKTEDEYKAGYTLATRFWEKVTGTKFDDLYKEPEVWQTPGMMAFIFGTAKMMGEDMSPPGHRPGDEVKGGMVYDKSPPPPNQ